MTNIYQTLYDLVNTYIFGNSAAVGSYEELMCIIASTAGCAFIICVPFAIVKAMFSFVTNIMRG